MELRDHANSPHTVRETDAPQHSWARSLTQTPTLPSGRGLALLQAAHLAKQATWLPAHARLSLRPS